METSGNARSLDHRKRTHLSNLLADELWQSKDTYANATLVGNWSEERFDVQDLIKHRPLPSQYEHNFLTTYRHGYCSPQQRAPQLKNYSQCKEAIHAFPAHQPILDTPKLKEYYSSYITCSMEYGSTVPHPSTTTTTTNPSAPTDILVTESEHGTKLCG